MNPRTKYRFAKAIVTAIVTNPRSEMSVLRVLTNKGDTLLEWNRTDAKSIEQVKAEFDAMMASGFQAFRVDSPTEGEMIRTFDPEADTIIMSVPMMGG